MVKIPQSISVVANDFWHPIVLTWEHDSENFECIKRCKRQKILDKRHNDWTIKQRDGVYLKNADSLNDFDQKYCTSILKLASMYGCLDMRSFAWRHRFFRISSSCFDKRFCEYSSIRERGLRWRTERMWESSYEYGKNVGAPSDGNE